MTNLLRNRAILAAILSIGTIAVFVGGVKMGMAFFSFLQEKWSIEPIAAVAAWFLIVALWIIFHSYYHWLKGKDALNHAPDGDCRREK